MQTEPFDFIHLWVLVPLAAALLGLAIEGGYRFGKWRKEKAPDEREQPVGAMVASTLGLLALVLGFTFSLAASRFDARRQAVLEEANAVSTAYLRAKLLQEPERTEIMRLLREYAALRAAKIDAATIDEMVASSESLHEKLWLQAAKAEEKYPASLATALLVQSLNQVIDVHAKRVLYGLRSRIPLVIWVGLFGLAFLSMSSVGYQAGIAGTRRTPMMLALVLAFGTVLYFIVDLDRGHEGLMRVSLRPLQDVYRSMPPP